MCIGTRSANRGAEKPIWHLGHSEGVLTHTPCAVYWLRRTFIVYKESHFHTEQVWALTSDCLRKRFSFFVTSNQLSHLQVAEKYTNTQVLSVKQRLKYVSGSQKFPKNQKWKIFCHFMQCKLAFLSVGIHQGTFLRHNCTCTEWCGVLKTSSLLVAHGNRASPLLKKGKQRKQGLRNCVGIFSILFIQNMHLDIGWNLNLLLVMAL